jgi:hypothetical protein
VSTCEQDHFPDTEEEVQGTMANEFRNMKLLQPKYDTWFSDHELEPLIAKIRPYVMPPVSRDALVDVANLVRVILAQSAFGNSVM